MSLVSSTTIRKIIARFAADRGGNIAAIFAIACIPVIAAMGVAVDYTRGSHTSSTMQDALDAATLALSRRSDLPTLTRTRFNRSPRTTSTPTSTTANSRTWRCRRPIPPPGRR